MKGSIFTGLLVLFIAWVILGDGPEQRIERSCKPAVWLGNLSVSIVQLIDPKYQDKTQAAFDSFDYGCRFSVWRLFYEKEYLKSLEEAENNNGAQEVRPHG